ncbi:MAG: amino acid ABC transporter permease [Tagaea sp.]
MGDGWARFVFAYLNPEVAAEWGPKILDDARITIELGLATIAAGLAFGMALAIVRACAPRFVGAGIVVFVDVFRAWPPLVVIIILFYAFPYIDLPMGAFTATWLALSFILASFAEEIWWAGLQSVPKGQWEAARSTGLTHFQALFWVAIPQAVRMTIPPLVNRTIAIVKGTALGSVVALPEILGQATSASSLAGNPTPLTLAALAYLAIFLPVVVLGRWIETRFAWKR